MNPDETNRVINRLKHSYECKIDELQDRHRKELKVKNEEISLYKNCLFNMTEIATNLSKQKIEIISNNNHQIEVRAGSKSMSKSEASKYNQSQANIGNVVDQAQSGSKIEGIGVQHNYAPEQNLAKAAAEIQALLKELEKTYSTETTTGKMTIATQTIEQIDNDPKLTQRILSALKAGGTSALDSLLDHPAASFVISALDDWQQSKDN